jgi:solute carrier family 25 carnitine/acylcarnitine transporter 20/29
LFGGITGLVSWLVIYPSDLIKTRIQDKSNIKTTSQIVRDIYNSSNKKIGFLNFYDGLSWALMRAIPLHAGVFLGMEYSKYLIEDNLL